MAHIALSGARLQPAIWRIGVVAVGLWFTYGCGSPTTYPPPATPTPASTAAPDGGGKAVPSPTGNVPVDLTLAGSANGHFTAVGISTCGGPMPGARGGYRTVIVADSGSQRVTIQFAIVASDYHGPGTYPEYKDVFNGGGEGLTVLVEPGDYFASVLPGDTQGRFTINSDGSSGTVSAVNLHGNSGGKVSLSGSWRCR